MCAAAQPRVIRQFQLPSAFWPERLAVLPAASAQPVDTPPARGERSLLAQWIRTRGARDARRRAARALLDRHARARGEIGEALLAAERPGDLEGIELRRLAQADGQRAVGAREKTVRD